MISPTLGHVTNVYSFTLTFITFYNGQTYQDGKSAYTKLILKVVTLPPLGQWQLFVASSTILLAFSKPNPTGL